MRFFIKAPLLASIASAGIITSIQRRVKGNSPLIHTTSSWSYTNCGTSTDAIGLNSFTLTPDPPVAGSPLTASISFTANQQIADGAYIEISVGLGFITLLTTTIDLCDDSDDGVLKDTGVSCPIEAGDYEITKSIDLPAEIPALEFTVEARGYTVDESSMFCVDVVADFSAAASAAAIVFREGL